MIINVGSGAACTLVMPYLGQLVHICIYVCLHVCMKVVLNEMMRMGFRSQSLTCLIEVSFCLQ